MSSIQQTIQRALAAAGLSRERHAGLHRTIESALEAAGLRPGGGGAAATGTPSMGAAAPVLLKEVDGLHVPVEPIEPIDRPAANDPYRQPTPDTAADAGGAGRWTREVHEGAHGRLAYRLYVPSVGLQGGPMAGAAPEPLPLIVMLHGCKQNPDDFARGTRMNALAEAHGFVVAYPEQARKANGSHCWNWFEPSQQVRGGREPSLITGMLDDIARQMPIDAKRVHVAGLSAGAAMALVLAHGHPERFAGVGVHSGVPLGTANDVPSAFAAMRGQVLPAPGVGTEVAVRTCVIHGDADATVAASNGRTIVAQALRAFERQGRALRALDPHSAVQGGRRSVRIDHVDADGRTQVREWRVHGGGHTWFGGSPQGSYTDGGGPDASAELVAFLLDEGPESEA